MTNPAPLLMLITYAEQRSQREQSRETDHNQYRRHQNLLNDVPHAREAFNVRSLRSKMEDSRACIILSTMTLPGKLSALDVNVLHSGCCCCFGGGCTDWRARCMHPPPEAEQYPVGRRRSFYYALVPSPLLSLAGSDLCSVRRSKSKPTSLRSAAHLEWNKFSDREHHLRARRSAKTAYFLFPAHTNIDSLPSWTLWYSFL